MLRWTVELGHVDICLEVSMMSSHLALPWQGHLDQAAHMFGCLNDHANTALVFDPSTPDIDEADFALIMNKKYKKGYFEFNSKKQQVELARKDKWDIFHDRKGDRYKRSDLPEELAYFVSEDGVFDCTKYFQVFVEEIHKVIEDNSIELPKGLSLTVKFTPCEVCKSTEDVTPQYVRCKHQPNCAEHKKKQQNPQYK